MRNTNFTALTATVSDTTPANGAAVDASQWCTCSATVVSTGTAAGTAKVQASNDVCAFGNVALDFTPTNWADVPSATIAVSTAGTVLIAKFDSCYRWLRVVFTPTSGAGQVTAQISAVSF